MARKRKTRKRVKRKKVIRKKSPFSTVMIAVIIIIIIAGIFISASNVEPTTIEDACVNSGGTVRTQLCCKSASDFPNMCLVGPCACSPTNSHQVKICDCGEGKCWDSNIGECVTL